MKQTEYFRTIRPIKHPEVTYEQCLEVVNNPIHRQVERHGRIRLWGRSTKTGRIIRVILLADGQTLHNAFIDSRFEKNLMETEE